MLFIDTPTITNPRINLAIEEHLLRNVRRDEPIFFLYINEPSVIIGRNQNVLAEIDPDYTAVHGIHVVRRLSGGGAVYHDLGNLNFSFITNGKKDLHNFTKFISPIIAILNDLGVPARLHGKSDIFVAGKKVSGNAQYLARDRILTHGTLLFNADLAVLAKALNPQQVIIGSKAVQSVRSVVTNIHDQLPRPMAMPQFKQALLRGLFAGEEMTTYALTAVDWAQIEQYRLERYDHWDWNIGRSF